LPENKKQLEADERHNREDLRKREEERNEKPKRTRPRVIQ